MRQGLKELPLPHLPFPTVPAAVRTRELTLAMLLSVRPLPVVDGSVALRKLSAACSPPSDHRFNRCWAGSAEYEGREQILFKDRETRLVDGKGPTMLQTTRPLSVVLASIGVAVLAVPMLLPRAEFADIHAAILR